MRGSIALESNQRCDDLRKALLRVHAESSVTQLVPVVTRRTRSHQVALPSGREV